MRILAESGVQVCSDESNSYETALTNKLSEDNQWITQLPDDTAIKVMFPQVLNLPLPRTQQYTMIWMIRNAKQQAKSQRAFSLGEPKTIIVSLRTKSIKSINRRIPPELERLGATVHRVSFDSLIRRRLETLDNLEGMLGMDLNFECIVDRDPKFSKLPVGTLEYLHQKAVT